MIQFSITNNLIAYWSTSNEISINDYKFIEKNITILFFLLFAINVKLY